MDSDRLDFSILNLKKEDFVILFNMLRFNV